MKPILITGATGNVGREIVKRLHRAGVPVGEVASLMSQILDRPVNYSHPSLPYFIWRFWRRGHPISYVSVVAAIYLTTRLGMAATITPHITPNRRTER